MRKFKDGESIVGGGAPCSVEDIWPQFKRGDPSMDDIVSIYQKCYSAEVVVMDVDRWRDRHDILFVLPGQVYMEFIEEYNSLEGTMTDVINKRTAMELLNTICTEYHHWYYHTTGAFLGHSRWKGLRDAFRNQL